ncbi:DoxX family protein [Rufibacter quisquiliarum]|uniref:DoxX-like family protein n=1 Tax=Rufibacter quisquiliarum TaxID=1549639 RepID=A0A839GMC9_9BACT|nr:DoxX family protein [Rufibacter quisquiliarum]MBA9077979.1 hypothetical protein [Rufibacter quisquiliarum]
MKKRDNIIYWVSTAWLCLGMTSTGVVQLLQLEEEAQKISELGYPLYLLPFLGLCKVLGVTAVLLPRLPLIKEWAYAGFFFLMTSALFSHLAHRDPLTEYFGPGLLLVLTAVSRYFRPAQRKVTHPLTFKNA